MWGEMFKAVFTGKHKLSPWTIIATIGMIVYTVSPIDVVPEAFVGPIGYIDDLGLWGVLSLVFGWERRRFEADIRARAVAPASTPKHAAE